MRVTFVALVAVVVGYLIGTSEIEGQYAHRCVDQAIENGWIRVQPDSTYVVHKQRGGKR